MALVLLLFLYLNEGPVIYRKLTNFTEEPLLLGIVSYGSSRRLAWTTTVKISSFSKCIMVSNFDNLIKSDSVNCILYFFKDEKAKCDARC